jgi:hypothetical protein
MGYLSERLATTITASLQQWRLRGESVEGMIYQSVNSDFKDGDRYIFMGGRLVHFPYAEGMWPDHYVLINNTGYHFYLASKEQLSNETSLA